MSVPKTSELYEDPLRRQSISYNSSIPKGIRVSYNKDLASVVPPESQVEWSNIIFVPFHPVFRLAIIAIVFLKAMLGPIQSVYPFITCYDSSDEHPIGTFIKYFYSYCGDLLYGIDTFLHIVHRQVVDKAMRREHLPKSAIWLVCDLLSLIPFFHLIVPDKCPPIRIWPNILSFNEFLVIYRVIEYFSLGTSHSYPMLLLGYAIAMFLCINCITCFLLLITHHGLCERCNNADVYYDWRYFIHYKFNVTSDEFENFVYGTVFIYSFAVKNIVEEYMPGAVMEFIMICIFMVAGYLIINFVLLPKAIQESMLRLRRICDMYPRVKKVVQEVKRRRRDDSHKVVETYYKLLWRKRSGTITKPPFIANLPRYLHLDLMQDLLWALFYHSPTLRKTSYPFRRWLAMKIDPAYKLPGGSFFSGPDTKSTLYYLKSGIVQLISVDDGVTPILSLTSGTVFGDISFFVPHLTRKLTARCLTYCEYYTVNRKTMIRSLHKYPSDRKIVMADVMARLNHAKLLIRNKQLVKGIDKYDDEGINWLKKRWWYLFNFVENFTSTNGKSKELLISKLPPDEAAYHCSKHIGQLVLCTQTELRTKSMFTNFKFPWIINPHSKFGLVWYRILALDVFLVLVIYPQCLIKPHIPQWFEFFTYCSDTIYAFDIGVTLLTAVKKEESITDTFSAVLFERFKSITFILDILSTIWIEDIAHICGASRYYYTLQFNRLIKIYVLFYGDYLKFDIRQNPIFNVCRVIALIQFAFLFVTSNFVFEMLLYWPDLTMEYFFGQILCSRAVTTNCTPAPIGGAAIAWAFHMSYAPVYESDTIQDLFIGCLIGFIAFIIIIYCKGRLISYLYLVTKDELKYQSFVMNLKAYYEHYCLHSDLLKRLNRYLICHWKYYKGRDVLEPNWLLYNEAREIFWKAQGDLAVSIITESKPFRHADRKLIKDLARETYLLILPRNTNILMFGIEPKNVTWVVQGYVKCEYSDENGTMFTEYLGPGSLLCVFEVLLNKASLRSYTSYTACEIMYIPVKDFFKIYQKYTIEYSFMKICVEEFSDMFNEVFKKSILDHKNYLQYLKGLVEEYTQGRNRIKSKLVTETEDSRSLPVESLIWGDPESGFMQSWMLFRVVVVCLSITCASILGGVGASYRRIFMVINSFCDCVALVDIVIKLCLPYYDRRGLYITDKRKCLKNYLCKGFTLDIIGAFPWFTILKALLWREISDDTSFFLNTICKCAHLYIVFAYFDYITDSPMGNLGPIMFVKWQIVNILIVFATSHYLMINCVQFEFNEMKELVKVNRRNSCWMPTFFELPKVLDQDQLHLIFAQSLNLGVNMMMRMTVSEFFIDHRKITDVAMVLFVLGLVFWIITCYTLMLLMLKSGKDTTFQHSLSRLKRFLKSERVENDVIEKVMKYFKYNWLRTKGLNIEQLSNARIGVMFRQDLSYYFYKSTLTILDSIIGGGETVLKQLGNKCQVEYFLPGHDICREMYIVTQLYIVHRGRVNIFKQGKKIIILSKGDIFGQLDGPKLRPINVTATADGHVDLMCIDVTVFHSIITTEIKEKIKRSRQARNDFMATTSLYMENPYNTIQYIQRGCKAIHLPRTAGPMEAPADKRYTHWLYLAWLIGPFISSCLVLTLPILPAKSDLWLSLYCGLFVTDIVHIANFIAEFYTIELIVENDQCIASRLGMKKFKDWGLYVDALSILIPLVTIITGDWEYQAARLLRLKSFFDFEHHLCKRYRSQTGPYVLKIAIILLLLHFFTCGWILVACRYDEFPIQTLDVRYYNNVIDFSEWLPIGERKGGCARSTRMMFVEIDDDTEVIPSFVVPKNWKNDYVVAMTFILLLLTHTSYDTVAAVSLNQIYYQIFVTYVMYLLDIWIMSVGINFAFNKYRMLYHYEYNVQTMMMYWNDNGICKSLLEIVRNYTDHLWKRQKGDWLPELAYHTPPCLRHDLFSALYIHHLEAAPMFRDLPDYFKRQLCARLLRLVIFPGKCIVREGDTFTTIYFIHEGEVEKWCTDAHGEGQLMSILYTNGYFGCVSGLFRNESFVYSYYSRTIVDLIYLDLSEWEDLLESYPEVKTQLYDVTNQLIKERGIIMYVIAQELVNPPTNGRPVRLEICGVMSHSTPRPTTMTWQATTLHVISLFIFLNVK